MSFSWDAIEQRTRQKQESDRALKDYLLQQQAETKHRKQAEKQNDIAEYQRNTGGYVGAITANLKDQLYTTTTAQISEIQPYSAIESSDFMAKLRYTETELQQERRQTRHLETELHHSKNAIATLTARVEKLSEQCGNEMQGLKEVTRQAHEAERRAVQQTQELSAKFEKGHMKLHSLVNDLVSRQKSMLEHENDENERVKRVQEELNSLRYKLESYTLQTVEVGNEVRAKQRDWEYEQQRGADTLRVVKDHDHALTTLHQTIDASSDSISKKLEMSLLDIRQRVDGESRARFQFESGMRELFNEVKKCVGTQERDMNDRIEGARQQAGVAFDRERMDRERGFALVMDEVRGMDKMVKEIVTVAMEKLGSQVNSVSDTVMQERVARGKFETQVKTEVEEGFRLIQQAVLKKFEEIQTIQADMRHSVGSAVKALKESVVLVERTTDQKLGSIEEVLRAEIRSRMETDNLLGDLKKELESSSLATERRAMTAISEAIEESRESSLKLEEELKRTAEQLIAAKTRSIDDLENQMELLRKRIIESDSETTSKIRMAHIAADQVGRAAQISLEVLEARIDSKFSSEHHSLDDLTGKLKLLQDETEFLKTDMEDKLNFRSLQTESTMAAFKEELEMRVSKTDVSDLETKLSANLSSLRTNLSTISQTIQQTRDDLELKPSKKDLEDAETRFKAHQSSLHLRIGEMDQSILNLKEETSDKPSRKDLEEHESGLKTAILNLELKQLSTTESLEGFTLELQEKANKKSIQDQDDRIKNYMMEFETKGMEQEENLRSMKDAIQLRVTKEELEETDKKLTDLVFGMQDRIGEISASVSEAKTEISQSMHDDVEEMVSSINGALDAVQSRADKIDNSVEGMKLRISESENSSRSRIQLFTTTVEALIAENSITIDKNRELCSQQVKEVSEKVDLLPKQMHATEVQLDDLKKRYTENTRIEAERIDSAFSDMREILTQKVSQSALEQLHGDLTKTMHRLTSQQEIESMAIESMRLKVTDAESFSRDTMREFRATLEKSSDEQASAIRSWRDSYSKRFEELDGRTASIPKMLDQTWAELRKLRFDVDERIRNELSHLEKEINTTKGEVATKVSSRNLDSAVSITVGPFNSRLDRLNHDIDDLRALTARLQGEISGKLYSGYGEYSGGGGPSGVNYHKPQLFVNRERSPAADPQLEKIVDLAESKRPGSAPEKEEY
ncbi:hypothetical protein HDU98_009284 [Podochytrium sp. JEL0797]|nr:hypothetical protein HDU98_009284 [Podochytrium sp. JEL0797]